LLLGQHWAGVLHPAAIPFVVLLILTLLAALVGTVGGLWRAVRGPRRGVALAWGLVCAVPLAAWAGLGLYAVGLLSAGRALPKNVFTNVIEMAGASALELSARAVFPHRLESPRLVMFYDDRVSAPHADLEAMERHLAHLEAVVGTPQREKIHWVRGDVFGQSNRAIRGLALGSARSPADWDTADHPHRLSVDRHELAHSVAHQLQPPAADPPTLLIEGWAEAYSGITYQKRAEFAVRSRALWRERTGGTAGISYLRELTGTDWYHRVDGPVYSVGGALAEYVVRKYGADKFLRLYFACRPGRFEAECEAQLGVAFAVLEAEFWADMERVAGGADGK
jgi:hypothetical protein